MIPRLARCPDCGALHRPERRRCPKVPKPRRRPRPTESTLGDLKLVAYELGRVDASCGFQESGLDRFGDHGGREAWEAYCRGFEKGRSP